ncbi:hypothetical protein GGQ22_16395 [Nocardioides sp. zg-579]|uniref:Uncharacterized protein n=1 Tax=Nocardioides marmotae TaxID=2663857 RepID=A0A6I3JEW2_9ACTN|nr:hypothetical protein [Nocardioides marmotae]MCR6033006.1 hypothetical protein [Gordonia jinghuaiqii]MTB96657.1 hypothetical protein [Nocardioides marmotae]QKE03125.1 hypothetical protein HPC71_20215 [Nocardioides marmotae]
MPRTVLAVPLLALLLTGCSGDSATPGSSGATRSSDASAAPEVRAGLAALYAGDRPGEEDTRNGECFADALLDRVSTAELEEAGVVVGGQVAATSPELEPDLAETWVDAMFSCMDFVEESARAQVAFTKGAVDWREYAACLRAELDEDAVRAAVVGMLSGDWRTPEVAALTDAQAECSAQADPR